MSLKHEMSYYDSRSASWNHVVRLSTKLNQNEFTTRQRWNEISSIQHWLETNGIDYKFVEGKHSQFLFAFRTNKDAVHMKLALS